MILHGVRTYAQDRVVDPQITKIAKRALTATTYSISITHEMKSTIPMSAMKMEIKIPVTYDASYQDHFFKLFQLTSSSDVRAQFLKPRQSIGTSKLQPRSISQKKV